MFGNVLQSPQAKVVSLQTIWTTPTYWKLLLKVKISNNNPLSLSLLRVSYTLYSGQEKLISKVFSPLPVIPSYGNQMIDIPINLPLETIQKAFPKKEILPLVIKGEFLSDSPWQKSALSFMGNQTIPVPFIPTISYHTIRTIKKKPMIILKAINKNPTALTLTKITGQLNVGDNKMSLAFLKKSILKPGEKSLIPLLIAGRFSKQEFQQKSVYISGEIEAISDFGTMLIPIHQTLSEEAK